jgi:hypothetical protein
MHLYQWQLLKSLNNAPLYNNMKKTLTILSAALITLFSFTAKAQDDKEYAKSYLSFIGGISTPEGEFAKSLYSDNSAGFAKRGVTFGLEGADYFHKNLAFTLTFMFQDQGELTTADATTLATGYNTDFKKDQATVTGVNRYSSITLMFGPQYSFLFNKFTVDVKASAGWLKTTSTPSVEVDFDYAYNTSSTIIQQKSGAQALAYGGGAGFRYSLGDSWDIGLHATYTTSSGIKIDNYNNNGTVGRYVTKQPVAMFQTLLSMTLKL